MAKLNIKDNNLSAQDLKVLYRRYSEAYDDKKRRLKARGIITEMYDRKYTKEEFDNIYTAAGNTFDIEKQKFSSEKAKANAIIDKLVERQATEFSHDQAAAFQKAYREREGKDIAMKEVYRDGPKMIKALNEKLKADGITDGNERQRLIGMAFFGS